MGSDPPAWRLTFTAPARRDLRRLDPPIARRVLGALGIEDEAVAKVEREYRARDKARLRVQAERGLMSEEARTLFRDLQTAERAP